MKFEFSGTHLASTSWDKTLRIWNVVESSVAESIDLLHEGLDVAYSPGGDILAVSSFLLEQMILAFKLAVKEIPYYISGVMP